MEVRYTQRRSNGGEPQRSGAVRLIWTALGDPDFGIGCNLSIQLPSMRL